MTAVYLFRYILSITLVYPKYNPDLYMTYESDDMTYLGTWAFLVLTLCWLSSTNTQVLRRPDLLSSKGKPLITKAGLKTVWTRLADRLSTVVADTLMITISPAWEYTGHFYDLYINAKENSKLTGDRMKLLMLTLPFIVSDLIALEVNAIYPSYTRVMPSIKYYKLLILWQITLINAAIDRARPGSRLHGLPHVSDPSDEVEEALIK